MLRENYKILEPQLKDGKSIIFLWKKKADIENATFNNIQKDMNHIFEKSGIINNKI